MKTNDEITQEAIELVEENNKVFCESLYLFAQEWVKKTFKRFTADDLRKAYLAAGNLPPRQPSAWGAPVNKLSKRGLIFDTGDTIKSTRKEAHNRPLRIWISFEYRLSQQRNATQEQSLDMFHQEAS